MHNMFGIDVNNNNGPDDLISITSNANKNNYNRNQNQANDNDLMPSQMSQEQSHLMQAQNGNGMVWTGFSGSQRAETKADNAECNLLNQEDDKDHLNDSIVFNPGSTVDHFP